MEPVLVTGTSGLVGYEVALLLQAQGADVLGLDLRPPPPGAPFAYVVGDAADLETVTRAMQGRPNVVHSGAISGPMLMNDDPYGIAQVNVGGALAAFEAARRLRVRRLVWLSSIAIYGEQPSLDPVREDAIPNPGSFYGHTKLAGEALLRGYRACYGLSCVALRLSSVYGVRRQTTCALRSMIEPALRQRRLAVPEDRGYGRQFVHVRDAARAIVLALEAASLPHFAYNITGGTYLADAAIARMIGACVPDLVIAPGPPDADEVRLGPLVLDAARDELGYQPLAPLQEGIAELCAHLA